MKFLRYPALMGALLILTGCAQLSGGSSLVGNSCGTSKSSAKAGPLADVDWDSARKLRLRIRQDSFSPTYLSLIQGTPYRLMIENADDDRHVFRAMEFFRSIDVSVVRVISGPGEGGNNGYNCSGAISVASGGITEARFMAVRDGVYEFDNNSVLLSFFMAGSAGGFIVVQPKRRVPESPVKHLKLLERKPLITSPASAPSGGLFDDDPVPEQPIEATPSVPVEELPVEELPAETDKAPAADLFSD